MCPSVFKTNDFLVLLGFVSLMCLLFSAHSFHVSTIPCSNDSLIQSCPASLYYVPNTSINLQETASLFHVNASVVNRTVDGFLVTINCSCSAALDYFTWHMDYLIQPRDSWESISLKFGSFVVEPPKNALNSLHTITLDFLCGCSETAYMVTYRVKKRDTLFTIHSQFNANLNMTARSNGLEYPYLIYDGDILFIPVPECEEHPASLLNSEKATIFPYYEIVDATSNFSVASKVGQGSYGSVYRGKLRGTDVAIKQMKDTKSKEFMSELNILCRVHHSNLIELIGYGAGGDSLFLVYEFAQNGALSDHLHNPTLRGHRPLPWITRAQIALDAAKGLEYIHEHTQPYYVHRDVKTSNILLDSNFRAKIADFGLVKLLDNSPDVRAAASRIVGTFGYLAPEYARDGFVTTKSDVYSFGVVLMELLTGQPALTKDASSENDQVSEHRSVVQYILSAFNDTEDPFTQLEKCVDPNLTCYHKDSLFQMALLSKDCVDDNWNHRPEMSRVVLRLSHILLNSKDNEGLECDQLTG
uniref:Protein kinase domain-containing protein n=1 Tax=Manihot esculenta TaxID=3983 RepID=A0A2C9W3S9_MANES